MSRQPLVAGAALALVTSVVLGAAVVLGTPQTDLMRLLLVLVLSGAASLLIGAALVRLVNRFVAGLQARIFLANGVCLVMMLVNVIVASTLMFLAVDSLPLFVLLVLFAGMISGLFGHSIAAALMAEIVALRRAATRLAAGDLGARVGALNAGATDEVGHLARTFDAMADRLEAAFARERRLESDRRDLIVAISHDLRTPLATTRAMVEAMADGVLSEPQEVRHYAQTIRSEVQHLSQLIDDLFELSQIESGALDLRIVPILLAELVSETVAAYHAQSRAREIVLEHMVELDLPLIAADPSQLQRVLRNLVDNALRYTPPGGTVRVEAAIDGEAGRVSISDTGPGLVPDEMDRVFEPFYRGASGRGRVQTTLAGVVSVAGLGLAIASRLIQAHGGRIWAEQSSADGAEFSFTVPLARRSK